jgi:S1-C subfamily serine protease
MRRLSLAVIAALLLGLPARAAAQERSLQEILLRAKPAAVIVVAEVGGQVRLRCGGVEKTVSPAPYRESGSGFFISPRGWVITNGHVVYVAQEPPRRWMTTHLVEKAFRAECLPDLLTRRGLIAGERPDLEDTLTREAVASTPADNVTLDPTVSVILQNGMRLAGRIAKYSAPRGETMSGRDLALLRVEAADMPTLPLGDSSTVKIGDKLSIIGFPGVVMSHELLSASAKAQASVTQGAVSGFKQDRANQPVIQTDAAAEAGISGGPALNAAGEVVGVMTFVTQGDAGAVQGFNFVIPSAAVRDFVSGTTVSLDETSRFNAAWHQGLADFFSGRYSRAVTSLAEANRRLPELPDLLRIKAEAAERAKSQPLLPWRHVGLALVLVSAAGYGVLWWLRRKRNAFRISPSEVARLLEGNEPPAILDVRETSAYERSAMRIPRSVRLIPSDLVNGGKRPDIDHGRLVVAYCT